MIGIICSLLATCFQAGAWDAGPAHVRVVAIGDFTRAGSPIWDASGNRLTPAQIKAIKGMPSRKEPGFDAGSLRNKTDIGRFVVLQVARPKDWLVSEDGQDRMFLGSSRDTPTEEVIYLSLAKGKTAFDIPFMAVNNAQSNLILEFTEDGPNQSGDITLAVKSHTAARVSYTKPKDKVIEKKDPLVQYIVKLEVPASWAERDLDLEAPGVVWPKSKEKFDPMGPEFMHGIMDEHPIDKDRMEMTLTIATPGAKVKNQKLRLVEHEVHLGAIKNLPVFPR